MDGAVSRVGEDKTAVDTPGRDQPFFYPVCGLDQAGKPGRFARVGFSVNVCEAFRTESRIEWERVVETQGASGAIAHREVRHAVHELVANDIEHRQRVLARCVDSPTEDEYAFAFRAKRRGSEEGIVLVNIGHGERAAVRTVDSFPSVSVEEVIVRPASVGMGAHDSRVVPVVIRVDGEVVRCPERFAGLNQIQDMTEDQADDTPEVESGVESDELSRPHPIVCFEAAVPPGRAQLPSDTRRVSAGPDGRLRFERITAVQECAVAGVGEIEVSVAYGNLVGQGVGAVRTRQYTERRLPVGNELSAVHPFEKRGHCGPRQHQRRIHVDPLVQGAEQRHGDAATVGLPRGTSYREGP